MLESLAAEHGLMVRSAEALVRCRDDAVRSVALERLNVTICAHLAFEEVVVHPVLARFSDDLAARAGEEGERVLAALTAVNRASDGAELAAVADGLGVVLRRHAARDERDRFPLLRLECHRRELIAMRDRLGDLWAFVEPRV